MSHDAYSKNLRATANHADGGEIQLAASERRSATEAPNIDPKAGGDEYTHSDDAGAARGDAGQQGQHLVHESLNDIIVLDLKQDTDDMEAHVKAQTKTPPTVSNVDTRTRSGQNTSNGYRLSAGPGYSPTHRTAPPGRDARPSDNEHIQSTIIRALSRARDTHSWHRVNTVSTLVSDDYTASSPM